MTAMTPTRMPVMSAAAIIARFPPFRRGDSLCSPASEIVARGSSGSGVTGEVSGRSMATGGATSPGGTGTPSTTGVAWIHWTPEGGGVALASGGAGAGAAIDAAGGLTGTRGGGGGGGGGAETTGCIALSLVAGYAVASAPLVK
jgi:hypothetical protein